MIEYPMALPLTTSIGTDITSVNGTHSIGATGAQTEYFYISWGGTDEDEIEGTTEKIRKVLNGCKEWK